MSKPNRSSSLSYASTANMESFLEKHGGIIGALMIKKYWCVLKDGKLNYYKDGKMSSAQGSVDINKVQSVRMSSAKGFCFEVTSGSKTQVFSAASAELRDNWIRSLQDAMSIASRRPSSVIVHQESVTGWKSFEEEEDSPAPTTTELLHSPASVESSTKTPDISRSNPISTPVETPISAPVETPTVAVPADQISEPLETEPDESSDVDTSQVTHLGYMNASGVQRLLQNGEDKSPRGPSVIEECNSDDEPADLSAGDSSTYFRYPSVGDPLKSESDLAEESNPGTAGAKDVESYKQSANTDGLLVEDCETDKNKMPTPAPRRSKMVAVSGEPHALSINAVDRTTTVEKEFTDTVPECTKQPETSVLSPAPTPDAVFDPPNLITTDSASRPVRRRSTISDTKIPVDEKPTIELEIDTSFTPTVVSDLQHPRLEPNTRSAFDDIREFLAKNEVYTKPIAKARSSSHPGQAIDSLKYFLAGLE